MGNPASCSLEGRRWGSGEGLGASASGATAAAVVIALSRKVREDDRSTETIVLSSLCQQGRWAGRMCWRMAGRAGHAGWERRRRLQWASVVVAWARCWAMRRGSSPPRFRRRLAAGRRTCRRASQELESSTVGVDVAARVLHPCDLTRTWVCYIELCTPKGDRPNKGRPRVCAAARWYRRS